MVEEVLLNWVRWRMRSRNSCCDAFSLSTMASQCSNVFSIARCCMLSCRMLCIWLSVVRILRVISLFSDIDVTCDNEQRGMHAIHRKEE